MGGWYCSASFAEVEDILRDLTHGSLGDDNTEVVVTVWTLSYDGYIFVAGGQKAQSTETKEFLYFGDLLLEVFSVNGVLVNGIHAFPEVGCKFWALLWDVGVHGSEGVSSAYVNGAARIGGGRSKRTTDFFCASWCSDPVGSGAFVGWSGWNVWSRCGGCAGFSVLGLDVSHPKSAKALNQEQAAGVAFIVESWFMEE